MTGLRQRKIFLRQCSFTMALMGSFFSPAKTWRSATLSRSRKFFERRPSLVPLNSWRSCSVLFLAQRCFSSLDQPSDYWSIRSVLAWAHSLFWRCAWTVLHDPCPPRSSGAVWPSLWRDLMDGLRFTLHDRLLVLFVGVSSIAALVGHLWYAVDVFFVQSSLYVSKESVGIFWAISGAGGLLGSFPILLIGTPQRQNAWLLIGLVLRGASLIWYATMTHVAWALPAAFLAGLGDNWITVALGSLLTEHAKPGVLGKVTAFSESASALTAVLALAAVSLLNSRLLPSQVLLLCGLTLCISGIGIIFDLRGPSFPPFSKIRYD